MDKALLIARSGNLPAAGIADAVSQTLQQEQAAVITAPPGAGKSTLLPLTLLLDAPVQGKILVLEPRRLAARQIAERMASLLDEPVGKTVGYRVRFETCVSNDTRLEVLTEGILTRMLRQDPTLDGVGMVIFDEFHERSLHSDLAFALSRQVQSILRPDLRLVVMSATIDATAICEALQAPLIESQGRMFPVEIIHAKEDYRAEDMVQAVARAVRSVSQEGDMLVFLPGQAEIMRCAELLQGFPAQLLPLYGNLSSAEQRRVIMPSADGQRRVILSTSIAETSLTIEGVRIVIDSGLCRTLVFDRRTGMSHLQTMPISLDMATQRTGRAGRMTAGVCYRLWTKAAEHRMAEHRTPEIESADLAPMLLDVASFGERDAMALPWISLPPLHNLIAAQRLLLSLGAIDAAGAVTPLGQQMSALPCHPRISRMILRAATIGQIDLACDIAALLEEKDPLVQEKDNCDLSLRIDLLQSARQNKRLGPWQRIAQVAKAYRRIAPANRREPSVNKDWVGHLVAYAYPERIAMQIDRAGRYRMASGEEFLVNRNDPLSASPWLAIASLNLSGMQGRVFLAAAVEPTDLEELATERNLVVWDSKQDCLLMQHEWRLGNLQLRSKPLHDASRSQQVSALCDAVAKNGLSMLSWSDDVCALQRRIAQVALWHPELNIPDLSTSHLLASAHEWLPYYIDDEAGRLRTSGAALRKIDLCSVLWSLVPYELQQEVDRLAPSHIVVPTGSRIRLDYRYGAEAPVLSVRLQECFGMEETPCVDNGRVPVLMELLSPGYKPVQLTQDLRSFWSGTYFEVRSELRRRYPKHHWPDNPLEAEAVRGVKRKA